MITGRKIRIKSMGKYIPNCVTSSELEKKYNIPLGWAEKYSGVKQRHHVTTETNGSMGAMAATEALVKANMTLNDIDMLISAGGTYDYPLPNQASIIKSLLDVKCRYNLPAIDIDSTCLSFVTALDFVSRILDGKEFKNILIVTSEIASKGLNHNNWETTTLFGDAAVAAIITFDPESDSLFIKGKQNTYSTGVFDTIIEGGGNVNFFRDTPYDEELHSFKMNGKNLLKLTKKTLPPFIKDFFIDLPLSIEQTDAIIPHQASKIGLHIFKKMYSLQKNQVKEIIQDYGNCIAASIPLTLAISIESGDIKRGDNCLLIGTSAGFSIGATLIKY